MGWLRRTLLILVCLLLVLALGGAAYQAVGHRLDARRSPEPGRLVDIAGGLEKTDYLILQAKYLKIRASELANIQTSAEQARAVGKISNKPLIVLAAGKSFSANPIPGLSPQEVANSQRIWIEELQPRLASLSARGKLLVLPDVGHNIPAERPDAIVEAVREIRMTAGTPWLSGVVPQRTGES